MKLLNSVTHTDTTINRFVMSNSYRSCCRTACKFEFNTPQEETKHNKATARIEAELTQRKLELERMEAKKQIKIARAKLKVYQEEEEFKDDMDSVEDDHLDTSPI